jgi:hypothetical protein
VDLLSVPLDSGEGTARVVAASRSPGSAAAATASAGDLAAGPRSPLRLAQSIGQLATFGVVGRVGSVCVPEVHVRSRPALTRVRVEVETRTGGGGGAQRRFRW